MSVLLAVLTWCAIVAAIAVTAAVVAVMAAVVIASTKAARK